MKQQKVKPGEANLIEKLIGEEKRITDSPTTSIDKRSRVRKRETGSRACKKLTRRWIFSSQKSKGLGLSRKFHFKRGGEARPCPKLIKKKKLSGEGMEILTATFGKFGKEGKEQ